MTDVFSRIALFEITPVLMSSAVAAYCHVLFNRFVMWLAYVRTDYETQLVL